MHNAVDRTTYVVENPVLLLWRNQVRDEVIAMSTTEEIERPVVKTHCITNRPMSRWVAYQDDDTHRELLDIEVVILQPGPVYEDKSGLDIVCTAVRPTSLHMSLACH